MGRSYLAVVVVQVVVLVALWLFSAHFGSLTYSDAMHAVDWLIILGYLAWILFDGIRRAKGTHAVEGYFLASRSLPWWAVGLSVMATQMSAITLVGTTGQGYADGVRFVQFYFGLPVAMIILSVTLVPFFHQAGVYTAYEYLERRFDAKTRALASLLFLLSRGLSAGVIIAAPCRHPVDRPGVEPAAHHPGHRDPDHGLHDVRGGAGGDLGRRQADGRHHGGDGGRGGCPGPGAPDEVALEPSLHLAGATGRLQAIDFSFDLNETYTFWSGLIGGCSSCSATSGATRARCSAI